MGEDADAGWPPGRTDLERLRDGDLTAAALLPAPRPDPWCDDPAFAPPREAP